jgi:2,3-dihydroxybiphenyl 1,2-dioxygenase
VGWGGGGVAARRRPRVDQLFWLHDPAGNRIELVAGQWDAEFPFQSPHYEGGFNTTGQGFGHVALVCDGLLAMEQFYVDTLGFGVSERLSTRVGPLAVRGTFMHCNARHHSLALFALPLKKRLHHFMLEANDLSSVGLAYERALATQTPLSLGLGQHPQPDGTFSFYAGTPSGFDYEIGWGGNRIEPQTWRVRKSNVTSSWGHRPHWRLQLKMAWAWLRSRPWATRRARALASHP